MATTDATPIPVKNQAYRVTFPILDADGDLVTAATALDSEVSKDAGTFVDCTNEAIEIAAGSGMYYLDITSTEMNADTVAIIVKTTTLGAKTTPMVLYPNKAGGLAVNVTAWAGTATATNQVALKTTLAKTTDITGFNDVSTAQVQSELVTYGAAKPNDVYLKCIDSLVAQGYTTVVSGRIDVAVSTRAAPGAAMTLTSAYDAAKTAASQSSQDLIATYVDTEVAAIKAKTDNLPPDPADASDIAASFTTVNTKLDANGTTAGAIKAKTDNLPVDPADASDIAASFSAVNAALLAIDDYVDTEVSAIKAKTDQLTFTIPNKVDSAGAVAIADVTAIAQAVLKLDWTTISGEATESLLQAARFLRNKWVVSPDGSLIVYKEDGTSPAWTRTVGVDPGASPIVSLT